MEDETTPLAPTAAPAIRGPSYVFPGGVSPRSTRRQRKMERFQFCIGFTLFFIIIGGLIIALILSEGYNYPSPVLLISPETQSPASAATASNDTARDVVEPLVDEPELEWALKGAPINRTHIDQAVGAGIKDLGDREILEETQNVTPINSPAFRHYRSLSTNAEARKFERRGYVENHATQHIAHTFNYTKPSERSNIGRGPRTMLPDPTTNFTCDFNSRYRTANGVCNNKMQPRYFGASMIPYRRMIAPDYADGISAPRVCHDGTPLPTARDVSLKIHRSSYETDSNFTVMLAVFGQFLDHDITATSLTTTQDGESIDCCTMAMNRHPECFPVLISIDDPFYMLYNVTCMNFVRSTPSPTGHFGPRQQLNLATAFIDGSVVYGNTDLRQRVLRSQQNGTLRMYTTNDGRQLLPLSTNPNDGCNRVQMTREGKYCFESGDDRANENLLLTSMHLLWARHHNYLAQGLQQVNPTWNDERIYQEARRILSAQMAHITYNEFLPVLLGRDLAAKKGLLPNMDEGEATDTYDSHVDASIANCFASAAFRFAHTLLPGLFNMTSDNSTPEAVELHKMLFNPFILWDDRGIDNVMISAINTAVQRVDRFFSLEVTQKLFEGVAEDKLPVCGLDLVSLNIQRGRDHGLPSYSVFRHHCQLPPVDTWEQMAEAVDSASLESIKNIYSSPYDVDVYTGALSEPPLDGAIFGPLLTCMVSDQFLRLKRGDSHFYERKIGPQRFSKDQLREIYKTTLSAIICRNSDAMTEIRQYVMQRYDKLSNAYVDCNDIKSFNFTPWNVNGQAKQLHKAHVSSPLTLVRVIQKPMQMANVSLSGIN